MNRNDERYGRSYERGDARSDARRDRDRDEWRGGERGRREFGQYDEERETRDTFYPGNYGFQEGGYTGRTAGEPERQPYSQNPYGRYPGQERQSGEWRDSPRYGQREPYNMSASGRGGYEGQEYGSGQRGGDYGYSRSSREGTRSSEGTRSYGGSRYSESQYGMGRGRGEYGRRAFNEGQFSSEGPFADTNEEPGYFGTGNYADGGASYGGGLDQRSRSRDYGSFSRDTLRSSDHGWGWQGRSQQQQRYRTGPKGYTRSDERLREDISERLMMANSIDSSEVTVSVKDCKVTLEGTVPNRHMKHAIEDLVDAAPGVQDIDNRIRVERMEGQYGSSQSRTGQSGSSSSASGSSGSSGTSSAGGSAGTTTGTRTRKE
jgi:osmotically-inducible protein OsmY